MFPVGHSAIAPVVRSFHCHASHGPVYEANGGVPVRQMSILSKWQLFNEFWDDQIYLSKSLVISSLKKFRID